MLRRDAIGSGVTGQAQQDAEGARAKVIAPALELRADSAPHLEGSPIVRQPVDAAGGSGRAGAARCPAASPTAPARWRPAAGATARPASTVWPRPARRTSPPVRRSGSAPPGTPG